MKIFLHKYFKHHFVVIEIVGEKFYCNSLLLVQDVTYKKKSKFGRMTPLEIHSFTVLISQRMPF